MNKLSIIITTIYLGAGLLLGCGTSAEDQEIRDDARNSLNVPENVAPPATTNPGAAPVATSGVQHYICPNNCAGSGGPSAGTCPVCGTAYEHNQAYHNQPANQGASTSPSIDLNTPGAPANITPPANASPAQNAAGVYHYTCSNGCAGGAASAVACASCGETLVHNPAYHN